MERLWNEVKQDHARLRTKLELAQSALALGPQTWFVLREVCYELQQRLRDHAWREQELIHACKSSFHAEGLEHVLADHGQELMDLRMINQVFAEGPNFDVAKLRPLLTLLIQRLENRMHEQEERLFPVLARLIPEEELHPVALSRAVSVPDSLTVNRLLQLYPESRGVLSRHRVNPDREGQDYLDEVAWHHGMECEQLLAELTQAIGEWRDCWCSPSAGRG